MGQEVKSLATILLGETFKDDGKIKETDLTSEDLTLLQITLRFFTLNC